MTEALTEIVRRLYTEAGDVIGSDHPALIVIGQCPQQPRSGARREAGRSARI